MATPLDRSPSGSVAQGRRRRSLMPPPLATSLQLHCRPQRVDRRHLARAAEDDGAVRKWKRRGRRAEPCSSLALASWVDGSMRARGWRLATAPRELDATQWVDAWHAGRWWCDGLMGPLANFGTGSGVLVGPGSHLGGGGSEREGPPRKKRGRAETMLGQGYYHSLLQRSVQPLH